MNFKSLIEHAEIRELASEDLVLPSIPRDGMTLLDAARGISRNHVACPHRSRFDESIEITSYPEASGPLYSNRGIGFLIWPGDLVIDGDLIDDAFDTLPMLVVHGDLVVRNWLRGGMPSFVGGSVRASGFIVGHYNDSALFVGGDLSAAGYIHHAVRYADFPEISLHQIAGRIDARGLDARDASDEDLRAAFVDEVLTADDEGTYIDERAILSRSNAGLPVWR
jgi:hypothetical protein